jgi:hypothetical protein
LEQYHRNRKLDHLGNSGPIEDGQETFDPPPPLPRAGATRFAPDPISETEIEKTKKTAQKIISGK